MHTLEPQTHMRLWRADFWRMSVANLLFTMAMYMLFPVLPFQWAGGGESRWAVGGAMALFGIGLYLLGAMFGHLVEAYRRQGVCATSLVVVLLATAAFNFTENVVLVALLRVVQGAAYGLAQMSLGSTLVLDLTDTRRRTEAGHSYSWFGRMAFSLGPLTGLLLFKLLGNVQAVLIASGVLTLAALVLILRLKVPFRAPLEAKRFSLDRFWLPQGKWLFLNFLPVSACMGLLLAVNLSFSFYGFIMVGFLLSLVAQKVVFVAADLRADVVSGLLLMGAAMLMHISNNPALETYGASLMIGLGVGLVASRFLLYFIKVSEHCQRSTAQTTYMLCWESGLCLGFFIGFGWRDNLATVYLIGLCLCIFSLIFYLTFGYKWLMAHRLR